jgi:hypothetical protein
MDENFTFLQPDEIHKFSNNEVSSYELDPAYVNIGEIYSIVGDISIVKSNYQRNKTLPVGVGTNLYIEGEIYFGDVIIFIFI